MKRTLFVVLLLLLAATAAYAYQWDEIIVWGTTELTGQETVWGTTEIVGDTIIWGTDGAPAASGSCVLDFELSCTL